MKKSEPRNTSNPRPEVMDLDKLYREVLNREPKAALPCNLSDFWLDQVGQSLEQVLEKYSEESGKYLTGPLALVLHVIQGKLNGATEFEVSKDALFEHFQDYRLEVALEEVNRRTDIKNTSATIETIFTNRTIFIEPRVSA